MRTHADAHYLQEAKEMQLDVSPLTGEEMQKLMLGLAATPPAVIARYKAAVSAN
jgi:hypothetical protein